MGGRGSGRPAGYGLLVDKCEDYRSIDLAWMRRRKMHAAGTSGSLRWSRGGQQIASVGFRVREAGLQLYYRTRTNGGDWQSVDEVIPFVWTETNFNGRRQWLSCLGCHSRCRIIYGGSIFRCRKCHHLTYESQYEPPFARAASQVHTLRKRLGHEGSIEDPFPPKPKGMHWRSYEKLEAQDAQLLSQWYAGVRGWMK